MLSICFCMTCILTLFHLVSCRQSMMLCLVSLTKRPCGTGISLTSCQASRNSKDRRNILWPTIGQNPVVNIDTSTSCMVMVSGYTICSVILNLLQLAFSHCFLIWSLAGSPYTMHIWFFGEIYHHNILGKHMLGHWSVSCIKSESLTLWLLLASSCSLMIAWDFVIHADCAKRPSFWQVRAVGVDWCNATIMICIWSRSPYSILWCVQTHS